MPLYRLWLAVSLSRSPFLGGGPLCEGPRGQLHCPSGMYVMPMEGPRLAESADERVDEIPETGRSVSGEGHVAPEAGGGGADGELPRECTPVALCLHFDFMHVFSCHQHRPAAANCLCILVQPPSEEQGGERLLEYSVSVWKLAFFMYPSYEGCGVFTDTPCHVELSATVGEKPSSLI